MVGIEPTLLAEPDFESGASTNSATPARCPRDVGESAGSVNAGPARSFVLDLLGREHLDAKTILAGNRPGTIEPAVFQDLVAQDAEHALLLISCGEHVAILHANARRRVGARDPFDRAAHIVQESDRRGTVVGASVEILPLDGILPTHGLSSRGEDETRSGGKG